MPIDLHQTQGNCIALNYSFEIELDTFEDYEEAADTIVNQVNLDPDYSRSKAQLLS